MRADTWVRPYKYFYYLYERILVLVIDLIGIYA